MRIVTCFGLRLRSVRVPPALTTISLPPLTADRTATTCGQWFGLESETRSTGAPKVSALRASLARVRATLPFAPIDLRPGNAIFSVFRFGSVRYENVWPVHGSGAISTGG